MTDLSPCICYIMSLSS